MQTVKTQTRPYHFSFWILSLSVAVLFSSCARKLTFGVSPVVPGAEGSVKIKTDKNKNYAISINVGNLAPADRLTPPKKEYVVWMEADGTRTKNLGRLRSASGLFSGKYKASLKTVTTFKPQSFFITAEDDGNTSWPGSPVVLRTN